MDSKLTISVLIDNEALPGLTSEWGLSLGLELQNGNFWLWDTGQSDRLLVNSRKMSIPEEKILHATGLALSHGHYDHTGGLPHLLDKGLSSPIYAHPQWLTPRFTISPGKDPRSIGAPEAIPRTIPFTPVNRQTELDHNLFMITDIPRNPKFFQAVRGFYFDTQGRAPDAVPDDAALAVLSESGPVLVLGCCHSGLRNTVEALRARLGITELHAVLGGFHLFDRPQKGMDELVEVLRECKVDRIHPGHCSGRIEQILRENTNARVQAMAAGMVFTF